MEASQLGEVAFSRQGLFGEDTWARFFSTFGPEFPAPDASDDAWTSFAAHCSYVPAALLLLGILACIAICFTPCLRSCCSDDDAGSRERQGGEWGEQNLPRNPPTESDHLTTSLRHALIPRRPFFLLILLEALTGASLASSFPRVSRNSFQEPISARRCFFCTFVLLSIFIRQEKEHKPKTFSPDIFRWGGGILGGRGGGLKVRYPAGNPGKPNFWTGYPRIFARISPGRPKNLRKNRVQLVAPT